MVEYNIEIRALHFAVLFAFRCDEISWYGSMMMTSLPDVLYEDNDIIVVSKPAGMASQPDRSLRPDMVNWLKSRECERLKAGEEERRKNGRRKASPKGIGGNGRAADYYVVHRLDLPVSGVMVYAKNSKAAASLSKQLSVRQGKGMEKEYLAVLTGIP